MKRVSILALLVITVTVATAQTLIVANNNPGAAGGTNVFTGSTALQDAIAAASNTAPFDIIYVVPSNVAYGQITIDRGLTIFGIGTRPDKDLSAKSQVGPIYINASDVRVSGIIGPNNGGIFIGWSVSDITYSRITIENSRFRELRQTNVASVMLDQVLVRNNIVFNNGWGGVEFYVSSNVNVTNNIIYCNRSSGSFLGNTVNVANNLFIGNGNSDQRAIFEAVDCLFDHNIFYGTHVNLTSASTGNVWDDNMSFGSTDDVFDVGLYANTSNSPNIESTDPLFVNMPINDSWSDNYDITLQTGSPALNINGTDIGPSGGAVPYDPEGNLLPLIQTISLPTIISVGADLPVTIKAKGN